MDHILKGLFELISIILIMLGLRYNNNIIMNMLFSFGIISLIHLITEA